MAHCNNCGDPTDRPTSYCPSCYMDALSDDVIMQRAVAARAMLDALEGRNHKQNKKREIAAFLAVFHPEMTDQRRRDFVRACDL